MKRKKIIEKIEEMQNNNHEFIKDKVLNSKLSWRKVFVREELPNVKDEQQ